MKFNERRFLRELEQEERRKRNRAEAESVIAEQGKKVIIGAIVTGAALLVGFHLGTSTPHAEVPEIPPYMVEPMPESFQEDGLPPVAIDGTIGARSDWEELGTWKITHYCPCKKCSGPWGHRTSSGATCEEGVTAACAILPPGTVVMIEGYGERIIQDTGAGVRNEHIDLFYESHKECLDRGITYRKVWVKK